MDKVYTSIPWQMLKYHKAQQSALPDNSVSADNELWFGVPLVVCDVVVSLQPNPLLTFGQEAIITGFTLSELHY